MCRPRQALEDPSDTAYWELLADKGIDGTAGPQGPQGIQGAAGPVGPQGLTGSTGEQGDTGPTGLTGSTGAQGQVGATGPQGIAGSTGATGSIGPQGPIGPTGAQGPVAMTWKGGWSNGSAYSLNDAVSFDGRSYINVQATTGAEDPSDTAYWELLADKGIDGTAGPQGPQGIQGAAGPVGSTGAQGPAGADGAQGQQGIQGAQGLTGADGVQGPQGQTGPAGSTGAEGAQGPQGEKGMNWRGEWQSGTNYDVDDVVSYAGSSYINTLATNASQNPSNAIFWELVAQSGDNDGSVAYRVVGFSSTQMQGNVGILGMYSACQSDFGSTARMATTEEIFLTPELTAQAGTGWVRPTFTVGSSADAISARSNSPNGITCNSWSTNFHVNGQVVDGDKYTMHVGDCGIARSVVCAIPTTETRDYKYVGFTTTQVLGDVGFLGMHNACQIDYGSNARMATSEEFFDNLEVSSQTGSAWLQPWRFSPFGDSTEMCSSWSSATGQSGNDGLIIDGTNLSLADEDCDISRSVACAIPR